MSARFKIDVTPAGYFAVYSLTRTGVPIKKVKSFQTIEEAEAFVKQVLSLPRYY